MADWKKYTLEEVCERIYSGGTPSTKHEEYWNGNIKWLSSGETSQRFVYDTDRKITQKGIENSSTKLATKGCTVIATAGQGYTRGQASFLMTDTYMNQSVIACKANEDIILPLYLYYNLDSRYEEFRLLSDGTSTRGGLSGWILKRMEIKVPPISLQEKIVDVLYSIDKKIEENNAINNNLEQQVDALYQEFFSPKSGTQGKISTLDEYCSIFTGKKNANASVDGGQYKFFTCAPDALQIDSYIYDGNAIIVSGNGAYTGRTRFYSGRFDLYQRTYACTLLDNINPDYIFPLYWFVKLELSKKIMGGTRGSAIPYIVMNDLAKFEFIYNNKTFAQYMPIFKILTETIQANEFENETLANTRDSLLPQLMSGELDVSDIDL